MGTEEVLVVIIGFILVVMAVGYLIMIAFSSLFNRPKPPTKAYLEQLNHHPLSDQEYQDIVDRFNRTYR
jgi:hypothetical protein